jgi:hypothetical protein
MSVRDARNNLQQRAGAKFNPLIEIRSKRARFERPASFSHLSISL